MDSRGALQPQTFADLLAPSLEMLTMNVLFFLVTLQLFIALSGADAGGDVPPVASLEDIKKLPVNQDSFYHFAITVKGSISSFLC